MIQKIIKAYQHVRNIIFYNITTSSNSFIFGKVFIAKNSTLIVGKNSIINSIEIIGNGIVTIGNDVEIRDIFINLNNASSLNISNNVFIGKHAKFIVYGNCLVGEGTLIAPDALIVDNDHIVSNEKKLIDSGVKTLDISIENNVWIGAKSIITKGVIVNQNCVVAASSFVNKSCDSDCLYAGIPARKIKEIYE